ncbi:MAG TPA: helix-turn-helix transcriptional regulator [Anaerovoracaceae bacterium]|nr:helix-turn-helix transcriptional regulator [Anaerovoracaceae bacterium]
MNSAELGKKIKEARIARKMTQNDVVGNFITRNMLSQIESGTATPSVKTLEYLSRVLDVPLFQLIPDQKEDVVSVLEKTKRLLAKGAFEKVLEMETEYPEQFYDEFSAILSRAYLSLAKQKLRSERWQEAARLSQRAMEYAEKGIYANATVKSESIVILNQAADKLSSVLIE